MNGLSWLILALAALWFVLALKRILRGGGCSCGGGRCDGNCAACGRCAPQKRKCGARRKRHN